MTLLCTYQLHSPGYPPPPRSPREMVRWWGFDQGGESNLSENPTPGTEEMVKLPHLGQGMFRHVLRLDPLNQVREHTQITVQTDDGQSAPPRNPSHGEIPHPRVKCSGQIPHGLGGGGGGGRGCPGACN